MTHLKVGVSGELFSVTDLLEIYVFLYVFTRDSAFYKCFVVPSHLNSLSPHCALKK